MDYLTAHLALNTAKFDSNIDIKLFHLKEEKFSLIEERDFMELIMNCRALIMSGGETAFSVLNASGFDYLESGDQILPLISTGTVHGGMLDGKKYIIKGGSLGEDDIYIKLIEHLIINSKKK